MESKQASNVKFATLLPSKWAAGAAAMLLAASLLGGCTPTAAPADATSTPSTVEATETPEVSDTETTTDTEGTGESDTMTDTEKTWTTATP